jgi:hypothetical protein
MHGAIRPLLQYAFMAWYSVKKHRALGGNYLFHSLAVLLKDGECLYTRLREKAIPFIYNHCGRFYLYESLGHLDTKENYKEFVGLVREFGSNVEILHFLKCVEFLLIFTEC